MVMTKKELIDQEWWNENVVFVEGYPADGEGPPFTFYFCFFLHFYFLFQTPHMKDYSQCLLGPIMWMSGLSIARCRKMSLLKT